MHHKILGAAWVVLLMSRQLVGSEANSAVVIPKAIPGAVALVVRNIDVAVNRSSAMSPELKFYARARLFSLLTNPIVVEAVCQQNAKRRPLEEIARDDAEWQQAMVQNPLQTSMLTNRCALAVKAFVEDKPAIRECFVMDDQGANVGQNELTSDYWQGDEDKWQRSYNDRKGGIDVGRLSFDKSANANLQQLSFPIIAPDGSVVGAVTFGIDLDRLEAAKEVDK
jgi:hypothetical protein